MQPTNQHKTISQSSCIKLFCEKYIISLFDSVPCALIYIHFEVCFTFIWLVVGRARADDWLWVREVLSKRLVSVYFVCLFISFSLGIFFPSFSMSICLSCLLKIEIPPFCVATTTTFERRQNLFKHWRMWKNAIDKKGRKLLSHLKNHDAR